MWIVVGGVVVAAFAGGFRLGQAMPEAKVMPSLSNPFDAHARQRIEAPEFLVEPRLAPEEVTVYREPAPIEPRPPVRRSTSDAAPTPPADGPAPGGTSAESAPTQAPAAAPVAPAVEGVRVLERTPVVPARERSDAALRDGHEGGGADGRRAPASGEPSEDGTHGTTADATPRTADAVPPHRVERVAIVAPQPAEF